jgi:predicted nucleic acid-binding Zn ribbon protein
MKRITKVVDDVIKDIGLGKAMDEQRILELWPEVAGEDLAGRAIALSFKEGCLYVAVANPSLRTGLTMRVPEFLERFNERLGHPLVRNIRFGRRSG